MYINYVSIVFENYVYLLIVFYFGEKKIYKKDINKC